MKSLGILCVTKGEERAKPFLEHFYDVGNRLDAEVVVLFDGNQVQSQGFLESCLNEAFDQTVSDYILRMDDDERISPAMFNWLNLGEYVLTPVWSFPRVHFWGDANTVIMEEYYFPDFQTRLTTRDKAKRDARIHAPNPHGIGAIAKVAIEHHCYLAKTYEERLEISKKYLALKPGGDGGIYRASTFEDEHPGKVTFASYNDGYIPLRNSPWVGTCADWRKP